ncbi:MAG: hypothetical protein AB8D52_08980 [Gammaproteobacteria bacterium]
MSNKIKLSHFFYMFVICLSLSTTACSNLNKKSQLDLLEQSLSDFRKALRWGYYPQATSFIQLKNYKQSLRDTEYLKNIRITSYEYGPKTFSEDGTTVDVIALINFYDVDRGTVSTISEKQTWWLNSDQKIWLLDGDIPNLTGR